MLLYRLANIYQRFGEELCFVFRVQQSKKSLGLLKPEYEENVLNPNVTLCQNLDCYTLNAVAVRS